MIEVIPSKEFASFAERFAARVIDTIIVLAIMALTIIPINILLIIVLFLESPGKTTGEIDTLASILSLVAGISFFVLAILISFGYFIVLHKRTGQTIGKKIIGIKVVKTGGQPLTWNTSVLREIGEIICQIALCIGYLFIIFDSKKQGWHDKIAKTFVIKLKEQTSST